MVQQYLKRFFTYEGRIARKQYLKDFLMCLLMTVSIFFIMFGIANLVFGLSYLEFALKSRLIMAPVGLALFFFPAVKRLRDVGWSAWVFSVYVFAQICRLMISVDTSGEEQFVFEALNAFEWEWMLFMTGLNLILLILSIILFFKKGIEGSNKYGPDPLAG